MNKKLFFAFSALLDEIDIDPKDIIKSLGKTSAQETGFAIIYMLIKKIHKAEKTYIPFVMELKQCTAEEADAMNVLDIFKEAFSSGDVTSFFTSGAQ